jgi:hypothetical protein
MATADDEIPIRSARGTPESFGWVRAPQYDTGGGKAYEQPDGGFYIFPPGVVPMLERLFIDTPLRR